MKTIILIPARMAATRLPGKPLADIHGIPMIVHVWKRAVETDIAPVAVACGDREIADAVEAAGGEAIMTDSALSSGTDRVYAALLAAEKKHGRYDVAINLQGDLPTFDPKAIRDVLRPLVELKTDIATLVATIKDDEEANAESVVKAIMAFPEGKTVAVAKDFTRQRPPGMWPLYHHLGIYAYTRDALERFTKLPPCARELKERLEQLRAMEDGITIGAALVAEAPFGVDLPEDLERARQALAPHRQKRTGVPV